MEESLLIPILMCYRSLAGCDNVIDKSDKIEVIKERLFDKLLPMDWQKDPDTERLFTHENSLRES